MNTAAGKSTDRSANIVVIASMPPADAPRTTISRWVKEIASSQWQTHCASLWDSTCSRWVRSCILRSLLIASWRNRHLERAHQARGTVVTLDFRVLHAILDQV